MHIRRAKVEDIINIVTLENKVFHESLGETFLYNELMLNPYAKIFIIEDKDIFVGYMGVRIDDQAEMMNLAIDPKYHHQGYGSALLTYVLLDMKMLGVKSITLEVRESNMKARSFYEKCGFTYSHKRKNYYPDEDAMVYIKEVNP